MSTPCAHVASASRHEHGPSVAAEKQMSIRLGHGLSRWARRCRVVQCAHGVRRVLCVRRGVAHLSPCRRAGARSPVRSLCRDRGLTISALATRARPRFGVASETLFAFETRRLSRTFFGTFFAGKRSAVQTTHARAAIAAMAGPRWGRARGGRIPDLGRFRRYRLGRRTSGPPCRL